MDNRPLLLIIAAGRSSRLGRPKQLLPYRGGTLLSHIVEQCLASEVGPVKVVLGSLSEKIRKHLLSYPVEIEINQDWKNGMGNSIAFGVKDIAVDRKGIIIILSDMPHVNSLLLKDILAVANVHPMHIVASKSRSSIGPPVYFPISYWERLSQLDGDEGARSIIKNTNAITYVDFAMGDIDIDTIDDLKHLDL